MHAKVHLELTTCPAGKWGSDLVTSAEALLKKAEFVASQPVPQPHHGNPTGNPTFRPAAQNLIVTGSTKK